MQMPQLLAVCGRQSGRITVLNQSSAVQESLDSACLIPTL